MATPVASNTDIPSDATPLPYEIPKSLFLEVVKSFDDPPFPQKVRALVLHTYSITMSPVLNVMTFIDTTPGPYVQAILKLYDRRFGTDLRDAHGEPVPHTAARESAFQSFVREGKMEPFLGELEEQKKTEFLPPRPSAQLDGSADGQVKYEAALWQECIENYECETKAYERLQDLQGKAIPKVHAHVRFMLDAPPDLLIRSETARYFEVRGILLQRIPGCNLRHLPTSPLAPQDRGQWVGIVQAAVDAAHEINKRGVLLNDCQPRNAVVDSRSQTPFIIDLAQCYFKDQLIEIWMNEGWSEDEDGEDGEDAEARDLDVEYWNRVRQAQNPHAIGLVMKMRVLRKTGVTLEGITYPDCDKIIEDIKRQKAAAGKDGGLSQGTNTGN